MTVQRNRVRASLWGLLWMTTSTTATAALSLTSTPMGTMIVLPFHAILIATTTTMTTVPTTTAVISMTAFPTSCRTTVDATGESARRGGVRSGSTHRVPIATTTSSISITPRDTSGGSITNGGGRHPRRRHRGGHEEGTSRFWRSTRDSHGHRQGGLQCRMHFSQRGVPCHFVVLFKSFFH